MAQCCMLSWAYFSTGEAAEPSDWWSACQRVAYGRCRGAGRTIALDQLALAVHVTRHGRCACSSGAGCAECAQWCSASGVPPACAVLAHSRHRGCCRTFPCRLLLSPDLLHAGNLAASFAANATLRVVSAACRAVRKGPMLQVRSPPDDHCRDHPVSSFACPSQGHSNSARQLRYAHFWTQRASSHAPAACDCCAAETAAPQTLNFEPSCLQQRSELTKELLESAKQAAVRSSRRVAADAGRRDSKRAPPSASQVAAPQGSAAPSAPYQPACCGGTAGHHDVICLFEIWGLLGRCVCCTNCFGPGLHPLLSCCSPPFACDTCCRMMQQTAAGANQRTMAREDLQVQAESLSCFCGVVDSVVFRHLGSTLPLGFKMLVHSLIRFGRGAGVALLSQLVGPRGLQCSVMSVRMLKLTTPQVKADAIRHSSRHATR
jgi:hypothetical protein